MRIKTLHLQVPESTRQQLGIFAATRQLTLKDAICQLVELTKVDPNCLDKLAEGEQDKTQHQLSADQ